MIRSLVRLLGLRGEMGRTSKVGVGRFSPRLETLDGRELPSTLTVGAGIDAVPAAVRSVELPTPPIWVGISGGASGGVLGDRAGMVSIDGGMSGGVLGDRAGMVSIDGGMSGGVLGDRAGMVSIDGGMSGGVLGDRAGMVSIDGGMSGGVLGDRAGMVSIDGGASGGVIGDRAGMVSVDATLTATRSIGEEIPQ